jgi:uncharacterized protein (DUF433 family)
MPLPAPVMQGTRELTTLSILPEKEATMDLRERITIEPGKRGGKPCVRGLRITVYDVLGWLAAGMQEQEILQDYPDLEAEDIRACLAFAAERERRSIHVAPTH